MTTRTQVRAATTVNRRHREYGFTFAWIALCLLGWTIGLLVTKVIL